MSHACCLRFYSTLLAERGRTEVGQAWGCCVLSVARLSATACHGLSLSHFVVAMYPCLAVVRVGQAGGAKAQNERASMRQIMGRLVFQVGIIFR